MTNSHITIIVIASILVVPIESISRTEKSWWYFFLTDEGSHTYIYYIDRRVATRNRLLYPMKFWL